MGVKLSANLAIWRHTVEVGAGNQINPKREPKPAANYPTGTKPSPSNRIMGSPKNRTIGKPKL